MAGSTIEAANEVCHQCHAILDYPTGWPLQHCCVHWKKLPKCTESDCNCSAAVPHTATQQQLWTDFALVGSQQPATSIPQPGAASGCLSLGFKHALIPRKNFQMSVRWLGRGFRWRSSSTKQLSKERHFPFYDHCSVKCKAEAAIALAMSAAAHLIEHHNGGCYLGAITESPVCRGIGASAIGPRKLVRLRDGW